VVAGLVAMFVSWKLAIGVLAVGGFVGWTCRPFAIYERGMRQGRKVLRWEDAEHVTCYSEVTKSMAAEVNRTAFLEVRGGGQVIRDVRGSFRLHNVVIGLLAPVLAARRLKDIEHGLTFRVGSVTLDKLGLTCGNMRLLPSEVGEVTIADGHLLCWRVGTAGKDSPCIRVSTTQQDVHVLAEILRRGLPAGGVQGPTAVEADFAQRQARRKAETAELIRSCEARADDYERGGNRELAAKLLEQLIERLGQVHPEAERIRSRLEGLRR
jgi:hypothetical protein